MNRAGSNAQMDSVVASVIQLWSDCIIQISTNEFTVIDLDATNLRSVHSIILQKKEIMLRKYAKIIENKQVEINTI